MLVEVEVLLHIFTPYASRERLSSFSTKTSTLQRSGSGLLILKLQLGYDEDVLIFGVHTLQVRMHLPAWP